MAACCGRSSQDDLGDANEEAKDAELKGHLEPFWGFLETFGGDFGAILEQAWTILAQLAPSWGYFGIPSGPAWSYLVLLGAILCHLGTILNSKPKINDSFTLLIVFNLQQPSCN